MKLDILFNKKHKNVKINNFGELPKFRSWRRWAFDIRFLARPLGRLWRPKHEDDENRVYHHNFYHILGVGLGALQVQKTIPELDFARNSKYFQRWGFLGHCFCPYYSWSLHQLLYVYFGWVIEGAAWAWIAYEPCLRFGTRCRCWKGERPWVHLGLTCLAG